MFGFAQNPLLPAQQPINPFLPTMPPPEQVPPSAPGPEALLATPAPEGPPSPTEVPHQGPFARYKQAWGDFLHQARTDPHTRLAIAQMMAGALKPAGTNAQSVGNALQAGINTMVGLDSQDYQRGQDTRHNAQEDRKIGAVETEASNRTKQLQQSNDQFQQNLTLQKAELEARLKEIGSSDEYRKGELRLKERALDDKEGAGTEGGQVNARWKMLTQAMMADPDEDLQGISDPKTREARARVRAFDLINKPSQTRQQFIASYLAGPFASTADPAKDSVKYQQQIRDSAARASQLADMAGLTDVKATPTTPPAATTTTTGPNGLPTAGQPGETPSPARQLAAGQTISVMNGKTPISGKITNLTDQVVTVDFGPGVGVKMLRRSALEGKLNGQP